MDFEHFHTKIYFHFNSTPAQTFMNYVSAIHQTQPCSSIFGSYINPFALHCM